MKLQHADLLCQISSALVDADEETKGRLSKLTESMEFLGSEDSKRSAAKRHWDQVN